MWKEIMCVVLFTVTTIYADELNEEDRSPISTSEGESSPEVAAVSGAEAASAPAAPEGEVGTRFLGIGDAMRRFNGALVGAVKGAITGAVTGHMSAMRPPSYVDDDEYDDDDDDDENQ